MTSVLLPPPDDCPPPTGAGLAGSLFATSLGAGGASARAGGGGDGRGARSAIAEEGGGGGAGVAGRTGDPITAVGISSGDTAGAPEPTAFPQDLQNLVSALASAPQFTQIVVAAVAAGMAGACPNGTAQLPQNFAPGRTSAPHDGHTMAGCDGAALDASEAPQLRQKRPDPASAAHFGHCIHFLLLRVITA